MSDLIFVGLDLSLVCSGICVKKNDGLLIKTVKTKPANFKNDIERLNYIVGEVFSIIPPNANLIVIEDIYVSRFQTGSSLKLTGLAFLMRKALYDAGYKFIIATANQIKKYTSGSGTCPKDQMTKNVYKRWGVDTKSDDEADAVAMCFLAESLQKFMDTKNLDNLTKPMAESVRTILFERPKYNFTVDVPNQEVKNEIDEE